jgi:hypothetical protein
MLSITMLCRYASCQEIAGMMDAPAPAPEVVEIPSKSDFDFFASDELLHMTLYFDIREFFKTRNKPEYLDAILTVKINDTDSISQHIKIKARGDMRREYCYFPPIMLKFKNKDQDTRPIQEKGTLKLVTHCNMTKANENYILKEYLTYRLYNLVTPYSFKTRLARINYVDVNKSKRSCTAYGFLIEDEDKMARRNQAVIRDNMNILEMNLNSQDMARLALFNYMIGNTDWSLLSHHNVKILTAVKNLSYQAIPVTYDFDYSGFVNTNYSTPADVLPIKNVTERYYLGLCMDDEELKPIIEEFGGLKEKFLSTIDNFEYLPNGAKKQAESYINSFYKNYKFENYLLYDLNHTCRQF